MSSDIFNNELPVYIGTRRSVNQDSFRRMTDIAGNYNAPYHEFNDIINIKYDLFNKGIEMTIWYGKTMILKATNSLVSKSLQVILERQKVIKS